MNDETKEALWAAVAAAAVAGLAVLFMGSAALAVLWLGKALLL